MRRRVKHLGYRARLHDLARSGRSHGAGHLPALPLRLRPLERDPIAARAVAKPLRDPRTRDEARRFLRDLCTLPELEALAHRWQTAKLLEQHVSYLEIAERVPTSTATVTPSGRSDAGMKRAKIGSHTRLSRSCPRNVPVSFWTKR